MGLRGFIFRRLIYSFALLIMVIILNFVIFKMMPGDPVQFLMQPWGKENPEVRKAQEQLIRNLWGLGDPMEIQIAKYIRNLLSWNFGIEFTSRKPIEIVMMQRVPYTVLLLGASTLIAILIGVLWGIAVIQRRGGLFDSASVGGSLFVGALPTFWLGLIFLLFFYLQLRWFPNTGAYPQEWAGKYPVPWNSISNSSPTAFHMILSLNLAEILRLFGGFLHHLFLPLMTLTIFFVGGWLLLTRATMLETVTEDYVLTARAKGLRERTVLLKHAFKNASLPIITSAALSFGFLLTGAIITETVFGYPGLGSWIWQAIQFLDYQVMMAIFYVVSICVIVANIIADLLYGVIDPRIKYG